MCVQDQTLVLDECCAACCSPYVQQVVLNFATSLSYGSEHIYQSLPRMLALWLDFSAEVCTFNTAGMRETSRAAIRSNFSAIKKSVTARLSALGYTRTRDVTLQ